MDSKSQISLQEQIEPFSRPERWSNPPAALRELLSYPKINFVSQYFTRTRTFEAGLDFVNFCYDIMWQYSHEISINEAAFWDRYLTGLRLVLYDRLNLWPEYIDAYADMLARYPDMDVAVRRQRLEIITRKLEKHGAGGKIGNMLRQQAHELAPGEREQRYQEMMRLFARMCRPPREPEATDGIVPVKKRD